MTKRKRIIISAAIGAIVLSFVFLVFRSGGLANREGGWNSTAARGVGNTGGNQSVHGKEQRQGGPKDPRLRRMFAEDYHKIKLSELEAYLAANNRSGASLATAFILSRDPSLLEELKKLKDQPEVAICLAATAETQEERKAFAAHYAQLKPDELTGYLLWAKELKQISEIKRNKGENADQEIEEMADVMKQAEGTETFSAGLESSILNVREALLSTGMDSMEADVYMLNNDTTGRAIVAGSGEALKGISALAIERASTVEEKVAVAEQYLEKSDLLGEISPYVNAQGRTEQDKTKLHILAKLPADTFLPAYGMTAGELMADTKKKRAEYWDMRSRAYEALKKADPGTVDLYMANVKERGLAEAEQWLLQETH